MSDLRKPSGLRRLSRLLRDCSGVAAIEFAMVLPVLTGLGMYGIEIANMAMINMQVSQMAVAVADNASRLQQTNNNVTAPTLTVTDVDSVMVGAVFQGRSFDFAAKGRVILSSLERHGVSGKQFIHWQRCIGNGAFQSAYGNDSTKNGLNGPVLTSMGRGANKVTSTGGIAVMFAEVYYDYEGIFGDMFVDRTTIRQEAAFIVRDARDLRASNLPGLTGSGGQSKCT